MVTFLAEPGLELWATDVGNAFLESYTSERVLFKAGPEFGDREGHTLVIVRAQYVAVEHVGTTNWPTSSEIWVSSPHYLRRTFDERKGDHYEYLAVYVDDIAIASKDPAPLSMNLRRHISSRELDQLRITLSCDYFRDADGTLCTAPLRYIEKMVEAYERMFGCKPKQNVRSLEKEITPSYDRSLLGMDDIKKYQSMIGALQWVVTIEGLMSQRQL
jgi:hypothetical protein